MANKKRLFNYRRYMSTYRDNPRCEHCVELQDTIDRLLGTLAGMPPYQKDASKACCLKCGAKLFIPPDGGGGLARISSQDDRWCDGIGWLKKCPKMNHMHRHCGWCGARWLERCKDQK